METTSQTYFVVFHYDWMLLSFALFLVLGSGLWLVRRRSSAALPRGLSRLALIGLIVGILTVTATALTSHFIVLNAGATMPAWLQWIGLIYAIAVAIVAVSLLLSAATFVTALLSRKT